MSIGSPRAGVAGAEIYISIYIYCDLFDIAMNRNHRNRGGRQGYGNQRSTRHTRNNCLYDDVFDTSGPSIAQSEASSDPMPYIDICIYIYIYIYIYI